MAIANIRPHGLFSKSFIQKTPYKARHTVFFVCLKCYFRCFLPLLLNLLKKAMHDAAKHYLSCCCMVYEVVCATTQAPR
jgi:hypothetical protein